MTTEIKNPGSSRNDAIQGLRAIAFIAIFISHVGFNNLGALGIWGVSVFFVMSGFLMMSNYIKKNKNPKFGFAFAWNKIKKLYPLHIFTMLFAAMYAIYIDGNIAKTVFDMGIHTLLIQTWIPNTTYYSTLNGSSWYLCTSFFLYMCFPLILSFFQKHMTKKRAYIWLIALFGIQVIISVLVVLFCNNEDNAWFSTKHILYYSPPVRLIDFGIGCGLGYISLFPGKQKLSPETQRIFACLSEAVVLELIVLSIFIYNNLINVLDGSALRYSLLFIPTTVPLIWLVYVKKGFLSKILSLKPLVKLGDLSPYTFLIHAVALCYVALTLFLLFNFENLMVKAVVSFVCTILAAIIWTMIEKYASRLFLKIKEKRTTIE